MSIQYIRKLIVVALERKYLASPWACPDIVIRFFSWFFSIYSAGASLRLLFCCHSRWFTVLGFVSVYHPSHFRSSVSFALPYSPFLDELVAAFMGCYPDTLNHRFHKWKRGLLGAGSQQCAPLAVRSVTTFSYE